MKVTKFVNVETQVDVVIDADDVFEALANLKDYEGKVVPAILSIKTFLDGIKDEAIQELNFSVRGRIAEFLNEAANRFDHKGVVELS